MLQCLFGRGPLSGGLWGPIFRPAIERMSQTVSPKMWTGESANRPLKMSTSHSREDLVRLRFPKNLRDFKGIKALDSRATGNLFGNIWYGNPCLFWKLLGILSLTRLLKRAPRSTWERECISVPALAPRDFGAFRCGTQLTLAAPLEDLPLEVELGQSPYEWTAKRSEADGIGFLVNDDPSAVCLKIIDCFGDVDSSRENKWLGFGDAWVGPVNPVSPPICRIVLIPINHKSYSFVLVQSPKNPENHKPRFCE